MRLVKVCDEPHHNHHWHCAASAHGRKNTQSKQNLILSTWKSKLKRDNDEMQWTFKKYSHSTCARIGSVNDSIIDKLQRSLDFEINFRYEKNLCYCWAGLSIFAETLRRYGVHFEIKSSKLAKNSQKLTFFRFSLSNNTLNLLSFLSNSWKGSTVKNLQNRIFIKSE